MLYGVQSQPSKLPKTLLSTQTFTFSLYWSSSSDIRRKKKTFPTQSPFYFFLFFLSSFYFFFCWVFGIQFEHDSGFVYHIERFGGLARFRRTIVKYFPALLTDCQRQLTLPKQMTSQSYNWLIPKRRKNPRLAVSW